MTPKLSWAEKLKRWQKGKDEALAKAMMSPPEATTLLRAVPFPGVIIIMGARGKGKSGLAYEIADQLYDRRHIPGAVFITVTMTHLGTRLRKLLPKWFSVVTALDGLPKRAVIILDEASQMAHARRTQSSQALTLDRMVGIARQKQQLLIFISHHSRKLDPNLIHESDRVLWKQPTYAHALFERDEIRLFTYKALDFFNSIKGEKAQLKACLMMDFHSLKFARFNNQLPSWFSDELSHIFENM